MIPIPIKNTFRLLEGLCNKVFKRPIMNLKENNLWEFSFIHKTPVGHLSKIDFGLIWIDLFGQTTHPNNTNIRVLDFDHQAINIPLIHIDWPKMIPLVHLGLDYHLLWACDNPFNE